ncbi:MAG: nucleotidyltransferase [Saprospiraceae bacterium]|nr:nucleotidyltransferase [Saprospiraceae bacterium]
MLQKKPCLLILAAGMGSRYGGLKQMDVFGPGGQTIMDFSIYDAKLAGFEQVVFVIRKSFADAFIAQMKQKWEDKMQLDFVFQETDDIPPVHVKINNRDKPWGTAHAVWVARDVINGPFGVINADDYYGREAMNMLYKELLDDKQYSLVAYPILDTLSEHGTVNRGVCKVDEQGHLLAIKECKNIEPYPKIAYLENGMKIELSETSMVSMNMWALRSDFFCWAEVYFKEFLIAKGNEQSSEFYIPDVIQRLMQEEQKIISVVNSGSKWYGVTYQEDKPIVETAFLQMIQNGLYPKVM